MGSTNFTMIDAFSDFIIKLVNTWKKKKKNKLIWELNPDTFCIVPRVLTTVLPLPAAKPLNFKYTYLQGSNLAYSRVYTLKRLNPIIASLLELGS